MKTLGNILWFLLVGLWSSVTWFILGLLLTITVIGIPLGRQCLKIAKLTAFPFGKTPVTHFEKHPIANVIWLILFGLGFAIGYLLSGIIFCITIIGIPFGRQCFKLAKLGLMPFGASVRG